MFWEGTIKSVVSGESRHTMENERLRNKFGDGMTQANSKNKEYYTRGRKEKGEETARLRVDRLVGFITINLMAFVLSFICACYIHLFVADKELNIQRTKKNSQGESQSIRSTPVRVTMTSK